jgi:hypothetical protein
LKRVVYKKPIPVAFDGKTVLARGKFVDELVHIATAAAFVTLRDTFPCLLKQISLRESNAPYDYAKQYHIQRPARTGPFLLPLDLIRSKLIACSTATNNITHRLSSKAAIADRLVHRSKALANLAGSNHNRYQVISQFRQANQTFSVGKVADAGRVLFAQLSYLM